MLLKTYISLLFLGHTWTICSIQWVHRQPQVKNQQQQQQQQKQLSPLPLKKKKKIPYLGYINFLLSQTVDSVTDV